MNDPETNSFTFSNAAKIEEEVSNKKITYAKLKKGKYKCNECSTKFCNQFLLNLHRVSRCPKLPYPCNICELRFSNEYNHKTHQAIHSASEMKQIAIAKMDAKLVGSDTNIGRSVLGQSPKKKASTIDSDSSTTSNRRKSARFLKEEALNFIEKQKISVVKDVELDEDGSYTNHIKNKPLKKNTLSSSEAKDAEAFSCRTCKIDFPDKTKLQRHMIVHGKKRSYQCDKCHMGFHWKSNYNRHMKTHSAPVSMTYVCVTCGSVFSRRFCLFRHRQMRHPEEEAYLEDEQLTDILSLPVKDEKTQAVDGAEQKSEKEVAEDIQDKVKQQRDEDKQEKMKVEVDDEDTEVDSDGRNVMSNEDDTTYYASEQEARIPWKRRRNADERRRHHCDVCHIQFKWKCDLNRHRITHSEIKAYPCDLCELGFNWKSNLTRHKRTVHRIGVVKPTNICDMCGQRFIKKFHLDRHVTKYCSQRPAVLEQIQAEGIVETEKSEVKKDSVDKVLEKAEVKEKSFVKKPEEAQMVEQTNDEKILPDINRKPEKAKVEEETKKENYSDFEPKSEEDHMAEESQEEILPDINQNVNIVYLHVCQKNGHVYDTESACENVTTLSVSHDDNETASFNTAAENGNGSNSKNVKETNLPYKIYSKDAIEAELNPFVCSRCGRSFARKTCHVQHERSHIIKPTKCGWCGKDFRRLSMLQKHERMHHKGEKPFPCDICSSHFELKSQLMQHMKSHFKKKSQLVQHMKSQHPSFKAFECKACKCRFANQSLLDRHQLVHVGERPYKCGTCDFTFDQSCSLVLHQRMHVIEYKCSKCDLKFTQQVAYVRHLERVHFNDSVHNNVPNRRVSTRRNRTSSRTYDPHAYNTRYKACKADVIIEEIDSLQANNPVAKTVDMEDGTAALETKPNFYNSALNQELFNSNEHESTSYPRIENSNMENREKGNECGTDKTYDPQNMSENSSQELFSKRQVRKDISVYESDSLNEFIKSYKRKLCDIGENSNSSDNTKFEVANEDTNLEIVQNKKIKNRNNKIRSRRSSEEIAISEGLANFHIGTYENNDFGRHNMIKDNQENNSSATEEKNILEENPTTNISYTKQGNFIIEDIRTVKRALPSIDLKCSEDMESSNEIDSSNEKFYRNKGCDTNDNGTELEMGLNEYSTITQEPLNHNETGGHVVSTIENTDYIHNFEENCSKLDTKNNTNEVSEEKAEAKQLNNVEVDHKCNKIAESRINISNLELDENDSLESRGCLEVDNSTKSEKDMALIQEKFQLVSNVIPVAEVLLETKEPENNTDNDKDTSTSDSVHHSNVEILPIQVTVIECDNSVQQERSTNNEETIRFRPHIEIIKVQKINLEKEKNTKLEESPQEDSTIIEKLQSLTEKIKDNPNENYKNICANIVNLTQKHEMQSNRSDELAHETGDLTDGIRIDKDNNYICEMHTDKNDCIRGICTDNDDCLSDINVDNDCINDNEKDSMIGIIHRNNDSMGKTSAHNSNNIFACVRAETSYTLQKVMNDNSLGTQKSALSLNNKTFKKTESIAHEEITNASYTNIASGQYSPDKLTVNALTMKNPLLDETPQRNNINSIHCNPPFSSSIDENSRFNLHSMKQEKALNLTCNNLHIIQPPVWKEVFDSAPNNNLPSCQYEFHANRKLNSQGNHNFLTGFRVDQNQEVKTVSPNAERHSKQFLQFHNVNQFQPETTWAETQTKEYPLNHDFVSHNENYPVYSIPTGQATYCPWNQQDGIVIERNIHASNEISKSFQEPPYENDIDEESIRYAVQTVQAIIQAEKPIHRESTCRRTPIQGLVRYGTPSFPVQNDCGVQETFQAPTHEVIHYQNFQVPSQYDYRAQEPDDRSSVFAQDMVRYQTPNYQAPVQNDGYVPQGLFREGGYVNSYQSFQPPYVTGSSQYGLNNTENSLRYGYVDRNADVHKTPFNVRPESVVANEARLFQLPVQYRNSPLVTYPSRGNSILYREHFEEGPKQYLDLVPVPFSSASEQYPKERASVNCLQLAPYERVEVTERVYTNLELASVGKPSAEGVVTPYKEVFNESGIVHRGQRSIVQNMPIYKDMRPYSATPNSVYSHPIRIRSIHTPSPTMFHYEKSYTYPSGQSNFQDPVHHVVQFEEHRNQFQNIQQDIPKIGPNSILVGSSVRGRKRARRGRAQSEVATPKKPRRKKNECLNAAEQTKSFEQDHSSLTIINQSGQNLNEKIETDKNEEIRVYSCGNRSKDSTHDSEIRISEKSFGCDECSQVFLLKNDLFQHRLNKHENNQSSSN
ncbi:hypothetical protein JTE90_004192 [Oedothorax gibbosus]|uniref:C2H2-type domain-containing protein n=1 Tax=Oedothorax gibbosus TaxID=931172 RepID=A0AAV6URM3_9ARAC|nr:hypothetical protein JTE90_004192 [Oedothorax gibbosus]